MDFQLPIDRMIAPQTSAPQRNSAAGDRFLEIKASVFGTMSDCHPVEQSPSGPQKYQNPLKGGNA